MLTLTLQKMCDWHYKVTFINDIFYTENQLSLHANCGAQHVTVPACIRAEVLPFTLISATFHHRIKRINKLLHNVKD